MVHASIKTLLAILLAILLASEVTAAAQTQFDLNSKSYFGMSAGIVGLAITDDNKIIMDGIKSSLSLPGRYIADLSDFNIGYGEAFLKPNVVDSGFGFESGQIIQITSDNLLFFSKNNAIQGQFNLSSIGAKGVSRGYTMNGANLFAIIDDNNQLRECTYTKENVITISVSEPKFKVPTKHTCTGLDLRVLQVNNPTTVNYVITTSEGYNPKTYEEDGKLWNYAPDGRSFLISDNLGGAFQDVVINEKTTGVIWSKKLFVQWKCYNI